jgi:hypothetical protein
MRSPSSALTAPRRALLGPADVADDELAAFAAAGLGVRHATVLTSTASVFPYDRPALTTAGRYLVTGTARTDTGQVRAFALFVKVIHSYQRSPLRFAVPERLRARAAALIPWHTEADLYRSDLRGRLPPGLTIPRAAVRDLDAGSAALWLEQVPARRVIWDAGRHARAAYLLGRLAASRAVAPLATAVHGARNPRIYAGAWLAHVVLSALTGNDAWAHPLVHDAFDTRLRRRLLAAADALPALLDELDDAPAATAHGDACTANLLAAGDRDALVMVGLGFCGRAPLGTDLGQLITGEVQTGQRRPANLPGLQAACLPAYLAGIHAEGGTAGLARVRRTHAALLTVFSALPSIPVEHLDDEPTPRLRRLFHGRAAIARFALDLLDDTRPRPSARPASAQPAAATPRKRPGEHRVLSDRRLRGAGPLTWASQCSSRWPDTVLSRLTLRIGRSAGTILAGSWLSAVRPDGMAARRSRSAAVAVPSWARWSPVRRPRAAKPLSVPGQCARTASIPTRCTTPRSTNATLIASSA